LRRGLKARLGRARTGPAQFRGHVAVPLDRGMKTQPRSIGAYLSDNRQSDDQEFRPLMAQEVVVGDVPSVTAGATEDDHVTDPDAPQLRVPGEHVARRAQLAHHVDRPGGVLGTVERVRPLLYRQHHARVAVPPGSRQPEVVDATAQYRERA